MERLNELQDKLDKTQIKHDKIVAYKNSRLYTTEINELRRDIRNLKKKINQEKQKNNK